MCYELYFRSRKAKEEEPSRAASEIEKMRSPAPAAEPARPVVQKPTPEPVERELETTPA